MKKILPIAVLLVLSGNMTAQWQQLLPVSSNTYNKLSFPSDDTGYAISGKVFRTFDGGVSFDSVSIPSFTQYTSISFYNQSQGVVTGAASVGRVAMTIDRGNNWNNITPANMLGIPMYAEFHSPVKGTVLSSAPLLYHTQDAGNNWDTISFGYDYFNTVSYPDSMTGYIGGFDGTFAYRGVIMKTTDGGVTWAPATIFTQWNTDIAQLEFVSADTGYAIFSMAANSSRILRTVDGALSWDTVLFNAGHLVDLAFLNRNVGYALNDSGTVFRTLNAGVTWTADLHPMGYFTDACVTPHFAYAGGNPGLMYKRDWLSGVQENSLSAQNGRIYPNPAVELLHLDIADLQPGDVLQLYSSRYQLLREYVVTAGQETIELDGMKPGSYVVTNKRTSASWTFIKK